MDTTNTTQQASVFSCYARPGTSILALNSANNRLIAAGQQNFQLLAIEQIDNLEQFSEIHDFRTARRQSTVSCYALQPKDVGWNPNDDTCFATASGTSGYLYIWDATRLVIINQLNIHSAIINRLQFHPTDKNLILTASQDGYAKLIDFRTNDTTKVHATFRHSSKEGFRDLDINRTHSNKFAAVINDQYCVPIWDIRQPAQPDFLVPTPDKVLCIAWSPHESHWLATGGIGGHDRTIRIWDAKGNDNRQLPLFTVYTSGQVNKLSWRPTCRYHIASSTRTTDQRIHVWDIRRAYLPQASFCHHRNEIEDFLWRPNSDNLISVARDKRLVHAHISSAIKSEQLLSFFSLNVTSKGVVHISMPNIDNEYVHALFTEHHIPVSSSSFRRFYSEETMSTFLTWKNNIEGRSILGIYPNSLHDTSIQLFHQFARRWTFGDGDKSSAALAKICDRNSSVAEDLKRSDLKATWQVIKMVYAEFDGLQNYQMRSSINSRSAIRAHYNSDTISSHRHHSQSGRRLINSDRQQKESGLNNELIDENKSREQMAPSNSKFEMIDDADTYIVRDVLTDDIIFITPGDMLNNGNDYEMSFANDVDIEIMREAFPLPIISNKTVPSINTDNDNNAFSLDQITRQYSDIMMMDDDDGELRTDNEYDHPDVNMQTSTHSIISNGSDKFFTIDEGYCPAMVNYPLNFDEIIRETLWYYVENNELQVAVHLLLALYPNLNEYKRMELFHGAHFEWLVMYIELLQKMRLFVKAKQVTKHCVEKEAIPLNYDPTDYDGSIILAGQAPTLKRFPTTSSPMSSASKNLPPIMTEFICSICRIPCRSMFLFCGVCFHGGHIDHIQAWFKTHDECPYGCGHRCQDRRTGLSQRFISKSSLVAQQ